MVSKLKAFAYILPWLFIVGSLARLCATDATNSVTSDLRFKVEGILLRNFPANTNLNASPVKFFYGYSNGMWMAQIDGATLNGQKAMNTNIRNIPGGTRTVHFTEGENPATLRMATATSFAYPPSESPLFVVWLACTPNPKLPIKDETHIGPLSRYSVGGTFGPETLRTSRFVQRLAVTNNGTTIGAGFKQFRASSVLSNGFKELEFEALRWSTNRGGFLIPAEAQSLRFHGNADGSLDALSHMRIQVTSIEFPQDPFALDFFKPPRVMAEDSRIADPTERPPNRYIVTNDMWMSVHYLPN
jgi:hypothetical protein